MRSVEQLSGTSGQEAKPPTHCGLWKLKINIYITHHKYLFIYCLIYSLTDKSFINDFRPNTDQIKMKLETYF